MTTTPDIAAEKALEQLSDAELLAREDASRILLFGGGFHREALIQYCRSLLNNGGGAR